MSIAIEIIHPGAYMQCRSYALIGPQGAVLLDPGSGSEEPALLATLAAAGVQPNAVKAVLLTHCHADHVMGCGRLRQQFGWPVYAAPVTARLMRTADPQIWGEHPELIPAIEVDGELQDKQVIAPAGFDIRCVATPGHTAGCLSFVVERAPGRVAAFTGDLIDDNGNPGWAGGADFSEANTLSSIDRLLACAPTEAHWGHGGPFTDAVTWLQNAAALGRAGKWTLNVKLGTYTVPAGLQAEL